MIIQKKYEYTGKCIQNIIILNKLLNACKSNTRSNSKIVVYNISLPNKNGKLGSKNERGDPCIFFCPGANQTKG
jgi:hypothetical protein